MINYKEIVEQLDIEKVKALLYKLEIPFEETDTYLVMPTVCHNIDVNEASWKLYYYKDNHLFYCYTNCEGMSIFTFLKNYYETRDYDYDWYKDIYLVIKDCSNYSGNFNKIDIYKTQGDRYKKHGAPVLEEYDKVVLEGFVKYYPIEWLEDHISKEAMDRFNILYSITQNKVIIPHYDVNGRLVGIRGRALNPEDIEKYGKYMPIKVENTLYNHKLSLNLYGLYENKETIKKNGICFLFESEKSVLQLEGFNIPNCSAAVCGSNLNIFQLKLLLKECSPREVVLCFDKEELQGEDKYFFKLFNICRKYKNYCNFSFIYDRENKINLKDSPSDKGEEIFKYLLERRVMVK